MKNPKKNLTPKARKVMLQYLLTDFAVEIGFKADKKKYNKAWTKLWRRIHSSKIL